MKRARKDAVANKENLNLLGPSAREKGKGKAREHERSRSHSETKDAPWEHMELDKEPNPFARLDRDYPQHPPARFESPVKSVEVVNHSDLNTASTSRFVSRIMF